MFLLAKNNYYVEFDVLAPLDENLSSGTSSVICSNLHLVIFCLESEIESRIAAMFPKFEVFITSIEPYYSLNV